AEGLLRRQHAGQLRSMPQMPRDDDDASRRGRGRPQLVRHAARPAGRRPSRRTTGVARVAARRGSASRRRRVTRARVALGGRAGEHADGVEVSPRPGQLRDVGTSNSEGRPCHDLAVLITMSRAGRQGQSAVVIGGGFIGTAVARALARSGRPTTLLSRRPMPAPAGVDVVYGDATDGTAMASLVAGGRDVVYAAGTSLPLAVERDPAQLVEPLRALVTVLEAVRINAGSSLLFLSSGGTVYGEPGHLPVTEDHPLRPRSAYGSEMVAAETYVAYYARRHGVAATSLRCANAYGPGQQPHRGQGLIATVLDAATHGQAVEVWGDGSAVRDYVFIDDLATAVVALL